MESEIKLEFIDIDDNGIKNSLLIGEKDKNNILRRRFKEIWNIEDNTTLTPLQLWLKYLSELNGLKFTIPANHKLVDAIMSCPEAYRFMFFIA